METGQRDKKNYYIAGILGILVICLLIGLWQSNYFENEVAKKDKVYLAVSNIQKGKFTTKKSEVNDVCPPKQCAIKVNALCTLGLIGVYHWFNYDNAKQQKYSMPDPISSRLEGLNLKYILAGVVLATMVCYIGCFVYQNYSFDATCAKDMAILFVGMPLIIKIFIGLVPYNEESFALGITLVLAFSVGFYLGSWLLSMTFPNNKLALLKQGCASFLQWFCSAFVLVDLYYQIHNIRCKENGVFKFQALLWCIPVAFLCIQNYWSPQLSFSSGYEIIDFLIAWPFWTTNLWLLCLFEGFYKLLPGKAMSGLVLVWLIMSYIYTQLLPPEKATTDRQQA